MRDAQHYHSIADAIGAMSLDVGFNPFVVGQAVRGNDGKLYRRATKAALAAMGYPVDPVRAAQENAVVESRCEASAQCQAEANEAYEGQRRREAEASRLRGIDAAMAQRACEAAGIPLQQCSIDYYGDEPHQTVRVTFADRVVIMETDAVKVIPIVVGRFGVDATGRRWDLNRARGARADLTGYVLAKRLGMETWFEAVPVRGKIERCKSDTAAVACLASAT